MPNTPRSIVKIADQQLGAFSRAQAHGVGLTDDMLRARVDAGWLVKIGPNAFRYPSTDREPIARLVGLMVDVGEPCWANGPTAAALMALDEFELIEPFHLVVPRGRQVRRVGAVIHTSEYLPESDLTVISGVRTTRAERTLMDLARIAGRDALVRALDSAVRDRRLDEDHLHARLLGLGDAARARLGVEVLVSVLRETDVQRGGHSFLERRFLELLDANGLPRPDTQQVLGRDGRRLIRVDFRFPGTNVVVEVLGHRYHRSREQMAIDARRMNALLADGYAPYQFTFEQVTDQPAATVKVVRRALQQSAA